MHGLVGLVRFLEDKFGPEALLDHLDVNDVPVDEFEFAQVNQLYCETGITYTGVLVQTLEHTKLPDVRLKCHRSRSEEFAERILLISH